MARREDPFMLTYYRFLPVSLQTKIDGFIEKLDETCGEFAKKRYIQGKTLNKIAEEMGYVERSLYSLRMRILNLWELTLINSNFEYQCNRVLNVIKRHGAIDHYRLVDSLNIYDRPGLNYVELEEILDVLLVTGQIKNFVKPNPRGRKKRQYVITNSLKTLSKLSQNI